MQRHDQPVTAAPVHEPGLADLPVVATGLDEPCERELAEGPVHAPGGFLHSERLVDHGVGHDEPAEPQAWCQALAGRTRVDDLPGRQCLHGADRLAVEPVLAVVVILDDHAAVPRCPADERGATRGRERHAEWVLVRRGQDEPARRREVARHVERGRRRAAFVHWQRHWPHAVGRRDPAVQQVAVSLHANSGSAPRTEHLADQREPVRESRADDHVVGPGDHSPRSAQVLGECVAQLRQAARVGVAENAVVRRVERRAGGCQPGSARERRSGGNPCAQVEALPDGTGSRPARQTRDVGGLVGDPGSGPGPGFQPTLGDELPVGVGDGVAGDTQVRGQIPG